MGVGNAERFFNGTGRRGVQLVAHAGADYALGIGIDLEGQRGVGDDLAAHDNVHVDPFR